MAQVQLERDMLRQLLTDAPTGVFLFANRIFAF